MRKGAFCAAGMLNSVKLSGSSSRVGWVLLGVALCWVGCRKQEQAVTLAAATAQQKAQAANAARDAQRGQLERISLPTKSRYVDVHEPGQWSNPFISVDQQMVNLRIMVADANPSTLGQGGMLRPNAARRQEVQIRAQNLAEALIALPESAWPYGRRGGD